jgi:copper chaperone CopZ
MCKTSVEGSLGRVPGVISYTVELNGDTATVVYDANQVSAEQIADATMSIGYKAKEVEDAEVAEEKK